MFVLVLCGLVVVVNFVFIGWFLFCIVYGVGEMFVKREMFVKSVWILFLFGFGVCIWGVFGDCCLLF